MRNKITIEKETLQELYVNEKLSMKEIGKIFDCGKTPIQRHLLASGIEIRKQKLRETISCTTCGKATKNPKFCCRSCAAIHNNKSFPKRIPSVLNFCPSCNKKIDKRSKQCQTCSNVVSDLTLEEAKYADPHHHRSSVYSLVRFRARQTAKKAGWNSCCNCGYNKHIEIAHINAISKFPETTLISEINALSNLLPLCPNCHWEFDRGLIDQQVLIPTARVELA